MTYKVNTFQGACRIPRHAPQIPLYTNHKHSPIRSYNKAHEEGTNIRMVRY